MNKCIMSVDDSATIRQMVAFTLKEAGYEVIEAVDGEDALKKLKTATVHMILADLNMPNMDGVTLPLKLSNISATTAMTIFG